MSARVLHRVLYGGAWAAPLLDAEIRRAALSRRDAALATEIVYGVLRVLPELDARIDNLARQGLASLEPFVATVLRAACYQLRHLARTPAYAVVDESVALVASARGRRLAGLTNGILRRVARPPAPEPVRLCLPQWLERALDEALGEERKARALHADTLPPKLALRVQPGTLSREQLAERLSAAVPRARVELGSVSPWTLLVRGAGDPRKLAGFDEGWFTVQEEGAQVVVQLLDARPGERVADLCAGRGNKTTWLAAAVTAQGLVAAADIDQAKLDRIAGELARLRIDATRVERHAVDLSVGVGRLQPPFDRVLVDAPCSGLGTVARRPELLLRVGPGDVARCQALQLRIMRQARKLVRANGRLAFAVCSPLPAEGRDVADRLERLEPGLERIRHSPEGLPDPDADGVLRLGPWSAAGGPSAPDMYQVIQWRVA